MTPEQLIEQCEARATLLKTPCGDGELVWRRWQRRDDSTQAMSLSQTQPIVVLFHGGFGSWLHWISNIEFLTQTHDVLAVDLPGLGDSDLPDQPVTPETLGATVAKGIGSLVRDAQLHFVAFSFGGVVAGQSALVLRQQLKSLTLAGSSGMSLPRKKMQLIRRTTDMSDSQRVDANLENLKRLMIADVDKIDDLAIAIHNKNDRQARLRSRQMSFGDSLAQALPILGHHGVQLNGIWGAQDVTAAPWIEERRLMLKNSSQSSRFEVIDNAGHWVAYEAAEQFNQLLSNFLNDSTTQ